MKALVCGATGCVGSAVVRTLQAHGHQVVCGQRRAPASGSAIDWLAVDFNQPLTPGEWARRLQEAGGFDLIVNAVGVLVPRAGESFERVHAAGPAALFRGAALAGVGRVIQVSALGVGRGEAALDSPYALTKLVADEALMGLAGAIDWAVVRPSLVFGPGSQSAALFAQLASLPVVGLPGRGRQQVQPVHVLELAEFIVRLSESADALGQVFEVAGPKAMSYREMLACHRQVQGLADPLWCPVPMPLMRVGARVARWLPQQVFSPDTLDMLEAGSTTRSNALPAWLGREPTSLASALSLEATARAPEATLPPALSALLRLSLATMWLCTAAATAAVPQASPVFDLLARYGFEGSAGLAMVWATCVLNTGLGIWLLVRPGAWAYATQCGAVLGYTLTAAWNMPELTIEHCGPLVKDLPILATLLVLWWTQPARAKAHKETPGRPKFPWPPRGAGWAQPGLGGPHNAHHHERRSPSVPVRPSRSLV